MSDYDGTPISATEEISQIKMGRPHVVLLGAGASRAAFPNGEANGKRLPLMADFMDIVPIHSLLDRIGFDYKSRNFEDLYTELHNTPHLRYACEELETIVFNYFSVLSLPSTPTLYDHLVLSLRRKDVIATFNWDPFLIQAVRRNRNFVGDAFPYLLFLHGNVAAGHCQPNDVHKQHVHGVRGLRCELCGKPLKESKLLFPIADKVYDQDPAIASAWKLVRQVFEDAFMVTVFGYGAPQSDTAAVQLLSNAWGSWEKRNMEEFEFLDIRPEDELLTAWKPFIHSHHYQIHSDPYESSLFTHPRRTGEAYLNTFYEAHFIEQNPLPRYAPFDELWKWFERLLNVERSHKTHQ